MRPICPRCGSDDLVRFGLLVRCETRFKLFLWLLARRKAAES